MSKQKLFDQLENLCRAINTDQELVWSLNCGGCAFFAVEVAKALKGKFVSGLTVLDDSWNARSMFDRAIKKIMKNELPNTIRSWNRNGVEFCHVLLTFDFDNVNYVVDGEYGVMTLQEYGENTMMGRRFKRAGIAPVEIIQPLVKTQRGWNSTFRSSLRPKVRKLIKKFVKVSELD